MSSVSSVNSENLAYLDLASPIKRESRDLRWNNSYIYFDAKVKKSHRVTPLKKERDLWTKIKHKLENKYEEKVPLKVRKNITIIRNGAQLGAKGINAVYQLALPYIIYVWSFVRFSAETEKEHFSTKVLKGLRKSKVCVVVILPVGLYAILKNTFSLAQAAIAKNADLAAEKGLDIVENVSDLTGNVSTVVEGLEQFGKIASDVASPLTTWLLGISAALSVITIVRESKRIYDSGKFWKNLKSKPTFTKITKEILSCEKKKLSRVFNVDDGDKFKERIRNIYVNSINDIGIDKRAMNCLKKKIITDNICRGLSIIVGTICIVATMILLFSSLATLGFALLAGATAIGLALLITNEVTKKRFETDMKNLADTAEKRKIMWDCKLKKEWKEKLEKDVNFKNWTPNKI